jgi:hypothetical protein
MLEVLTSYPALDVMFIHEILRHGEGSKKRSEQTIPQCSTRVASRTMEPPATDEKFFQKV